jgi:hypothetical protein
VPLPVGWAVDFAYCSYSLRISPVHDSFLPRAIIIVSTTSKGKETKGELPGLEATVDVERWMFRLDGECPKKHRTSYVWKIRLRGRRFEDA